MCSGPDSMMDGFVDRWESMHNRIGQPNMCSKPAMIFSAYFPTGRPGANCQNQNIETLSAQINEKYKRHNTKPKPLIAPRPKGQGTMCSMIRVTLILAIITWDLYIIPIPELTNTPKPTLYRSQNLNAQPRKP